MPDTSLSKLDHQLEVCLHHFLVVAKTKTTKFRHFHIINCKPARCGFIPLEITGTMPDTSLSKLDHQLEVCLHHFLVVAKTKTTKFRHFHVINCKPDRCGFIPLEITWDNAGHKFVKTRSPTRGVSAPFPSRSLNKNNKI